MSTNSAAMNSKTPAPNAAAEFLEQTLSRAGLSRPTVGVILGSGLGCAADRLIAAGGISVDYGNIPGMPVPQVVGHHGTLICGRAGIHNIVMLKGRVHWYEGRSLDEVLFGVRLLAQLGIRKLVVTNAAGGIRSQFTPGDLMVIRSHLRPPPYAVPFELQSAFANSRPFDTLENRELWSESLRKVAFQEKTALKIHEGTYAMMPGPCYETPAEIRMLRTFGADAVGMSTVPESVTAAALGMSVLGVSCITNCAAGLTDQTLSHHEVTETASAVSERFSEWIWNVICRIGH